MAGRTTCSGAPRRKSAKARFLSKLLAAHQAGRLAFFGNHAVLAEPGLRAVPRACREFEVA